MQNGSFVKYSILGDKWFTVKYILPGYLKILKMFKNTEQWHWGKQTKHNNDNLQRAFSDFHQI